MARYDDRFAEFTPAPLGQTTADRGIRATAGGAVGAAKGALAGFGLWTLGAAGIAGTVALLSGVGVLAALGWAAGVGIGFGFVGGTTMALLGGIVGGFKGYSKSHQQAGLDQSTYNIAIAEAIARGQTQAVIQAQQQQHGYVPQMVARDAAPNAAEIIPIRRDDASVSPAKVAPLEASNRIETNADARAQYDGKVIANNRAALAQL